MGLLDSLSRMDSPRFSQQRDGDKTTQDPKSASRGGPSGEEGPWPVAARDGHKTSKQARHHHQQHHQHRLTRHALSKSIGKQTQSRTRSSLAQRIEIWLDEVVAATHQQGSPRQLHTAPAPAADVSGPPWRRGAHCSGRPVAGDVTGTKTGPRHSDHDNKKKKKKMSTGMASKEQPSPSVGTLSAPAVLVNSTGKDDGNVAYDGAKKPRAGRAAAAVARGRRGGGGDGEKEGFPADHDDDDDDDDSTAGCGGLFTASFRKVGNRLRMTGGRNPKQSREPAEATRMYSATATLKGRGITTATTTTAEEGRQRRSGGKATRRPSGRVGGSLSSSKKKKKKFSSLGGPGDDKAAAPDGDGPAPSLTEPGNAPSNSRLRRRQKGNEEDRSDNDKASAELTLGSGSQTSVASSDRHGKALRERQERLKRAQRLLDRSNRKAQVAAAG